MMCIVVFDALWTERFDASGGGTEVSVGLVMLGASFLNKFS